MRKLPRIATPQFFYLNIKKRDEHIWLVSQYSIDFYFVLLV